MTRNLLVLASLIAFAVVVAGCSAFGNSTASDGLLTRAPEGSGAEMTAIVGGGLELDPGSGCVLLDGKPVVWPTGTSLSTDPPEIHLPGDLTARPGDTIRGGGGEVPSATIRETAIRIEGDLARALRCAPSAKEVIVFWARDGEMHVSPLDNPGAPQRQPVYLRALVTIPGLSIHYGHNLSHVTRMPLAHPRPGGARTVEVVKTEEKGSDVNLATYLLLDAFKSECEIAVVISNDSDLKLPIEVAQAELGLRVGVVNPHPPARRSRALQPTFFKQIRSSALAACQFPPVLTDSRGAIRKPPRW